ncbi:MAG: HNH endonuclease [Candidatus Methylomirabilales bacterium]
MARTHGHGNPKWTRDETILALDLYFQCHGNIPSRDDKRVQELSSLLRRLPYHPTASRRDSFRNPDGVAFKLQNLRQVATGKGLGNVSEMDRRVWAELGARSDRVRHLAELIRNGVSLAASLHEARDGDEDYEFAEGRILTEIHKRRERAPDVRKRLLASRRRTGRLVCDMCRSCSTSGDRKFEDATFEAHHVIPVSMTMERKTRLKDTALLCANCHRLIHRAISVEKRWLSISEGRQIVGLLDEGAAAGVRRE